MAKKQPPPRKPVENKPAGTAGTPPFPSLGEKKKKKQPPQTKPQGNLFIVGIGASAGGLRALEKFFDAQPKGSGMAFVVVTHQHPGHTGLLSSLIKRHSSLRIFDVEDGIKLQPDGVYFPPAGKNLSLLRGMLFLLDPSPQEALRLPIDFFFRSLAQDQKHRAIGVILSGAGSDGTVGLKAIKAQSGFTIVQDPKEAEYSGMPQSALAAQVADCVLPVREIPGQLQIYRVHPVADQGGQQDVELAQILPKILSVLRVRIGNDFSLYKQKTLLRRIERRMTVHGASRAKDYLRLLQTNPNEATALFQEFLIGVTGFFRDPSSFESLTEKGLASLLAKKQSGESLRVWVPACSSGEEAYSVAMILKEQITREKKDLSIKIFATDLDQRAINTARLSRYPAGIASNVSAARLQQFFIKEDGYYCIKKEIRNLVVFAAHNLLADPPFRNMDLISCRNVLIYLDPHAQRQLLFILHYALRAKGLLLLGTSEMITAPELFTALDRKAKLFEKKAAARVPPLMDRLGSRPVHPPTGEPAPEGGPGGPYRPRNHEVIEAFLLEQYAPASVIVTDRGEIVHSHGGTARYLEPRRGAQTKDLMEMAREDLKTPLDALLREAKQSRGETVHRRVRVAFDGEGNQPVRVAARLLQQPRQLRGLFLVTFETLSETGGAAGKKEKSRPAPSASGSKQGLMRELSATRHRLQLAREEMETSNEEFKATNEEFQSTNEELQSTNEELETAKEELQSLNEELTTLNTELETKLGELADANDDLMNLLESAAVATIFLDANLSIRRFTAEATKVIRLIPGDVGRPLADLVSNLTDDHVVRDAQEVLRTIVPKEAEVQTKDGAWYFLQIRPYRTAQNVIDGVVLTFQDIRHQKRAEQVGLAAGAYFQSIVETIREPLLVLDTNLRVVSSNQAFYRTFKMPPLDVEGKLIYRLHDGQWDLPKLRELLENILPNNRAFEGLRLEHVFPLIGKRTLLINARRLEQESGLPGRILIAFEDITGRQSEEKEQAAPGHDRRSESSESP